MAVIADKRLVLGIGFVAAFLFVVFAAVSYFKSTRPAEVSPTCPAYAWAASGFDLLTLLVTIGIVVGAATYYLMSQRIESREESLKKNVGIILKFLGEDERKAVNKIIEGKGRVLQAEITRLPGMSKVRAHRALKRLLAKGIIASERFGKTNVVKLVEEVKEGLV